MLKRAFPIVASVAALSFLGAGCNPVASVQQSVENKIGQSVAQGIVSQATGGKVNLNENGNSVSFTDNKTGGTMAFGDNVAIPSDFPKDAPIYPGATANGVVMQKTGDMSASLTLKTTDDVAKVAAWYDAQLKSGWSQDESSNISGMEIRSYSKADAKLDLTISSGGDNAGSSIVLVYTPQSSSAPSSTDSGN
ncbi:MAG: hypothetical protein WA001_05395 [Patescibacteria group bacterium]